MPGQDYNARMQRRHFLAGSTAGGALTTLGKAQAPTASDEVFLERPDAGMPHKGKVLLAIQAHSDDVPLMAAGTVAKLIEEGH